MMNPTLADLILETKARNGYSYESFAKACGGVPGAGRLHQLATKEQKTFPDPETINGLARGCKVTPMEVIRSAARSLGLNVSDNAADSVHIHGYDQLPGKLKATIQDLGEQVAELAQKAGDGDGKAAPMKSAEGNSAISEDDGLGSFGGRARGDLDHESVNDGSGDNVRDLFTPPPPPSETAAKRGKNTGRSIRRKQDEDAERPDPDPNED